MTTITATLTLPKKVQKPAREPVGRIPRVSRLMALAIKLDGLLRDGGVRTQAELAEVGGITRARLTQILNLTNLAPDLQESLLFLPLVMKGKDPISEHVLREVVSELSWASQRALWAVRLQSGREMSN